jgi:hypothetical protein
VLRRGRRRPARRYRAEVDLVLASSMQASPPPGRSGDLVDLFGVIVVLAVIGLCLYLLFRRGSIADRARRETEDDTEVPNPES